MKLLTACLLATASAAYAVVDFTPIPLNKLVAQSNLIVVGKPSTLDGMRYSDKVAEFILETELVVSEVIKGTPPKTLKVHWEHHISKGPEPIPLDREAIWLLERRGKQPMYYLTRSGSRLPLTMKAEIVALAQKQKRKK